MSELEKDFEKEAVDYVEKELGGYALKLKIDGRRGFPDRTILLPGGIAIFLELKRSPSAHQRAQQVVWVNRLQDLGFVAEFCWNMKQVKQVIARLNH